MESELRFLDEIGPAARSDLLAALIAPEAERAARIGRLHSNAGASAHLVAELLTELEINEPARLRFLANLREMQGQ